MAIIEDGVIVDGDAYLNVVADMKALRPVAETVREYGVTLEEWALIGNLAFGGDGFNQVMYDLGAKSSVGEAIPLTFPWRRVGAFSYKRDSGSSKESIALYGDPDVVLVMRSSDSGRWLVERLQGKETLPDFGSLEEAILAVDRAWPWKTPVKQETT